MGGQKIQVSFDVKNTGMREGADVAQVYAGTPKNATVPRPLKELKGFEKVFLKAGETKRVNIVLDRAFSYYDTGSKDWRVDEGDYEILVGRPSAETVLSSKTKVK